MYLPIVAILLVLCSFPLQHEAALVEISLVCQSESDFYHLLYQICTKTVLCRELFYLESLDANITALARERDFRKFHYQLAQIAFFHTILNTTEDFHEHHYHHHGDGTLVVEDIWPSEWAPNITVTYVGSAGSACSENYNMTDLGNMLFIYSVLDTMKTYKQYISNEHYCNDYNERAIFDTHLGEFHCICPSEKVCYKEGSWRQMILSMTVINIAIYLILVVAVFLVGIRLLPNHQ